MTDKNTSALTAYAVVLRLDDGTLTIATPAKTPDCARQAISPFEGAHVFGLATIAVEQEPVSGMQWRLGGGKAEVAARPDGYAYRYPDTFGKGTVIRHNGGGRVNGSDPIESIPYFYHPPRQGAGVEYHLAKKWRDAAAFDNYMTGIPRIDDPTHARNTAMFACADELEAACSGKATSQQS